MADISGKSQPTTNNELKKDDKATLPSNDYTVAEKQELVSQMMSKEWREANPKFVDGVPGPNTTKATKFVEGELQKNPDFSELKMSIDTNGELDSAEIELIKFTQIKPPLTQSSSSLSFPSENKRDVELQLLKNRLANSPEKSYVKPPFSLKRMFFQGVKSIANSLDAKDVALFAVGLGGAIVAGVGIAAAGGVVATSAVVVGAAFSVGAVGLAGYRFWSAGVDENYALSTNQPAEARLASERQSRAFVGGLGTAVSSLLAGSLVSKLLKIKGPNELEPSPPRPKSPQSASAEGIRPRPEPVREDQEIVDSVASAIDNVRL